MTVADPWCVRSLDRDADERVTGKSTWCRLAYQDKTARYSDNKKTACDFYVILPAGIERRKPTCEACIALETTTDDGR